MSASLVSIGGREMPWHPLEDSIVIGKDILELLSSSMYVDPMTIYREYVQNAADSIDDARMTGQLQGDGTVEIRIDQNERHVTIRDNGSGVGADEFVRRMTAFGASAKRGTSARGFRGVGRLAGIGYCQELVFRSRTSKSAVVSELRWDCRKLKSLLRSGDRHDDLASAVAQIVSARTMPGRDFPSRFFEVELRGIIRHRNDQLLSPEAIRDYLGQVAPVPFHPSFPFGAQVVAHLGGNVQLGHVHITINDDEEPVTRPHREGIEYAPQKVDPYTEVETFTIPGVDGGVAALGWIVHHGYVGALTPRTSVRGLRLRCGNVQIGDERLLEELFPEARFAIWCVGEVHILDQRIVPNGRRDHFEQNVHYHNVLTHLLPAARDIARRCRTSSVQRKWMRDFELREASIREHASILKQGALGRADRQRVIEDTRAGLSSLSQIVNKGLLPVDVALELRKRQEKLEREMQRVFNAQNGTPSALAALPPPKRRVYEHVIGLIYECSPNRATAQLLVDKIISRLT